MPFVEHVGVVIGQLLTRRDVANGLDPDASLIDHRVAVFRDGTDEVVGESAAGDVGHAADHVFDAVVALQFDDVARVNTRRCQKHFAQCLRRRLGFPFLLWPFGFC